MNAVDQRDSRSSRTNGARISVVINTLNEEKNLPLALRSVRPWVDEIVVVDMYSDDATVDVAKQFDARIYYHERLQFADPARAFALAQATGDWILVLDADEIVPFPLSRRLLQVVADGQADAVRMPFLHYLLGAPLMHTNWGPRQGTLLRFFKRDSAAATGTIHNYLHVRPGSRVVELEYEPGLAIVHFNYFDSRHFIDKLNRYTSVEAEQVARAGKRISRVRALATGLKEFASRYVKGQGFRDGWRGFYLSIFMVFYRISVAAKVEELRTLGDRAQIESNYRKEAESIVSAYEQRELAARQ